MLRVNLLTVYPHSHIANLLFPHYSVVTSGAAVSHPILASQRPDKPQYFRHCRAPIKHRFAPQERAKTSRPALSTKLSTSLALIGLGLSRRHQFFGRIKKLPLSLMIDANQHLALKPFYFMRRVLVGITMRLGFMFKAGFALDIFDVDVSNGRWQWTDEPWPWQL